MTLLPTGSAETLSGVRPCGIPLISTSAPEGSEFTSRVPTRPVETALRGKPDLSAEGLFHRVAVTESTTAPESGPTAAAAALRFPVVPTFVGIEGRGTVRSAGLLAGATVGSEGTTTGPAAWVSREVRRGSGAMVTVIASTINSTRVAAPAARRPGRGRGRWSTACKPRYAAGTCKPGRAAAFSCKPRFIARSWIGRAHADSRPSVARAARRTLSRRGDLAGGQRCRERSRIISGVNAGVSC